MDTELIIRAEAKDFYDRMIINSSKLAIEDFHAVKSRIEDFYSSADKACFLDEVEVLMKAHLQEHREQAHGGESIATCGKEVKTEKLLFYIKQEIGTLPVIAHQKFSVTQGRERNKVFVSYSHLYKRFLSDIQRHFKPFLETIDYWDDSKISPGQKWKQEIGIAISATKVAILLVSTDFLGSDFIITNELPPLLSAAEKDGATILTIILKPCLFEEFNDLNKYQAMNPPSRPVSKMEEDEKEELLVNLVRQTKRILVS